MRRGIAIPMFALLLAAVSAAVVHTVSLSNEAAAPAEAPPALDPKGEPRPVDRALLSPLHREILEATEAERAQVEELNARFLKAVSPAEKRTIQQAIESAKKEGMIAVFEIQLHHARAEERTETVRRLETAIESLRHPQALEGPGTRMIERESAGRPH